MNLEATTALASPVKTGAKDSFAIAFAPLSLQEVYQLADDAGNGAVVVMSGTVRNQTDGKPVVGISSLRTDGAGNVRENCPRYPQHLVGCESGGDTPSRRTVRNWRN